MQRAEPVTATLETAMLQVSTTIAETPIEAVLIAASAAWGADRTTHKAKRPKTTRAR
jgi:hypothetical protein